MVIVVVSSLFDFVDGGVFGSWLWHWGSGVSEAKVLKFSMTRALRVGSLGFVYSVQIELVPVSICCSTFFRG